MDALILELNLAPPQIIYSKFIVLTEYISLTEIRKLALDQIIYNLFSEDGVNRVLPLDWNSPIWTQNLRSSGNLNTLSARARSETQVCDNICLN